MRYRTVIELICEAASREEAGNTAGEYLRGDVDFGVEMSCRTIPLWSHKMKKCAVYCLVLVLVSTTLLLKVTPLGGNEKISKASGLGYSSTCTIMPALKTKHKADFREKWEKKKNEAVFEYIKK